MEKKYVDINDFNFENNKKLYTWVENGMFNKIHNINKDTELYKYYLKIIEKCYEETESIDLPGCVYPSTLFYYDDQYVGNSSSYLEGYEDLRVIIKKLSYMDKIEVLKNYSIVLKNLHDNGFVHNDLDYGNNIMVKDFDVKIIDFDLAQRIVSNSTNASNTRIDDYDNLFRFVFDSLIPELKRPHNLEGLPQYIKDEYYNFFKCSYKYENDFHIKSIPTTYPHEWLDELKDYRYENGVFIKTK